MRKSIDWLITGTAATSIALSFCALFEPTDEWLVLIYFTIVFFGLQNISKN